MPALTLLPFFLASGETADGLTGLVYLFFLAVVLIPGLAASFTASIALACLAFRKRESRDRVTAWWFAIYGVATFLCVSCVVAVVYLTRNHPPQFDWTLANCDPFVRFLVGGVYLSVILIIPNVLFTNLIKAKAALRAGG
jgi:Na+/melibiose symporter-like transporter